MHDQMKKKLLPLLVLFTLPFSFYAQTDCDQALAVAARMPTFPSAPGVDPSTAFRDYTLRHLQKPENSSFNGFVEVSVLVDRQGILHRPSVLSEVEEEIAQAALDLVKGLPPFSPAIDGGDFVCVIQVLRIEFGLKGEVSANAEPVYKVAKPMPRFYSEDCEKLKNEEQRQRCAAEAMLSYVNKNINYPAEAIANKTTGTVVISFVVEIDGSITNPVIVRNVPDGCGQAALDVIRSMSPWMPGYRDGEAVRVLYNFPVKFTL